MLSEIVMDDVRAKTRKEELKALPKKERKRLLLAAVTKVEEKITWLKDEASELRKQLVETSARRFNSYVSSPLVMTNIAMV